MKRLLALIFVLTLLVATGKQAQAQYVLKDADVQYELFNYTKAIDLYEQAYQKKQTLHAAKRLAECYEKVRDFKQAESWFAIVCAMQEHQPEDILAYAYALQSNSKYMEAKTQYQKYAELNKSVTTAQKAVWLASCDSAMHWMRQPKPSIIQNEKSINTLQTEWGLTLYGDQKVFSSDRTISGEKPQGHRSFLKFDVINTPNKYTYGWTGNQYLKLYFQNKQSDSIQLFPLKIPAAYHIGPASFTADGKQMYFALTSIANSQMHMKSKLTTVCVEIFSSTKDQSGNWSLPVPFKYNKVNEYSLGDPFITSDGKDLYFVSDMPGGMGGTDLYVSHLITSGEWGVPENLKELNTEGNERTPTIDNEHNLYFSSDGGIGMGGLDIFQSKLINNKPSAPRNMGYPTNSPQDDFAYLSINKNMGYFSSNRSGGVGEDDIYTFYQPEPLVFNLHGKVVDKNTLEPLANAIVSLNKVNGQSLKVQTDGSGLFKFGLEKTSDYELLAEKTGFRSDSKSFNTHNLITSTEIVKELYLEKIELNKPVQLENIYYDFDKWNIRPDATIELDKLVKIMHENPTLWIEIGSHTDSRGNDQYNHWLSQKRAESTVRYIIARGIAKNRITAKGYGETMPLNKCTNGVRCTEAEYQLNRRTEFKIVKN